MEIKQSPAQNGTLDIAIAVTPYPTLESVRLTGINKKSSKKLHRNLPLVVGLPLPPAEILHARLYLKSALEAEGHPYSSVSASQVPADSNTVHLELNINAGPRLHVEQISFEGNEPISARDLQRAMTTKERVWWKFWEKARFEDNVLEQDLTNLEVFLHEKGYFDARISQDTVLVDTTNAGIEIRLNVDAGRPYYIRSIGWEGHTLYSEETLNNWLDISPGDRYNLRKLEENLYGNTTGRDISSQYMNLGYMRFGVTPRISVAGEDSLDLYFELLEGDAYTFGEIEITGNHTTNDHVIRRELFSIPGERFSRSAIQESLRRLVQTGRFGDHSLLQGPAMTVDEAQKKVHLRYTVEETSFPRPQITGSLGQFGLVLGMNLTYNNFSLQKAFDKSVWRPFPSGDGQEIGFNVQASANAYQRYGFSFAEPWLGGKPAPLGVSTSYTHIGADAISSSLSGSFNTYTAQISHERRLKWPSPYFNAGIALEYRTFDNTLYDDLPTGRSKQLSVTQSISRNTTDHPFFASKGSYNRLSVEIGLPVGDLIQYHKWRFQSSWNLPLTSNRQLSLHAAADLGYVGSLNGSPVNFERFVLGGSPLDSQGLAATPILGTEVIFFRGYPLGAFDNPDGPVGQRLLTKYTTELRWMAFTQSQFQVMPYLFFDAANTWNSHDAFRATSLFRSAGAGLRVMVPMLGLVEMAYGRNLDAYTPPAGSTKSGQPGWGLQFSIGRSFNF